MGEKQARSPLAISSDENALVYIEAPLEDCVRSLCSQAQLQCINALNEYSQSGMQCLAYRAMPLVAFSGSRGRGYLRSRHDPYYNDDC